MTATITDVLDETMLDFEPMCEFSIGRDERRCGNVAKWIAIHKCTGCERTVRTLTCDRCKEEWELVEHQYAMRCGPCGAISPAHTEWEKL